MSLFSSLPTPSFRAARIRPLTSTICAQCRSFQSDAVLNSGHSKWSKIKHQKGAADAKKSGQRAIFSKQLTLSSKLYGPDPNMNSDLAHMIAVAKKAGMPKANIDDAIARGQGRTQTGTKLEGATLEVMLAPSMALIIDIETDNKNRSLADLRMICAKKHGGTVTPTAFLFTRRGRAVLAPRGEDQEIDDFDDVMMQALDAGAEDVEQDGDGNLVLWTQPNKTHQVAQDLSKTLDFEIHSSDIIWLCTSDKTKVDDPEAADRLAKLLVDVSEYADVLAVYHNAERGALSEGEWDAVEQAIES
ncbi:duf28 domain-containing protein [Xylariaceae sp. FL1272]|nr:duf28 domain-containing protein [Xylariaceae sp. FL1272]